MSRVHSDKLKTLLTTKDLTLELLHRLQSETSRTVVSRRDFRNYYMPKATDNDIQYLIVMGKLPHHFKTAEGFKAFHINELIEYLERA